MFVMCFPRAAQIDKCFGFDTAVEQAQEALLAAKVEAGSAYHGIGVVKLMGRSSGFIAMQASLASGAPAPGRTAALKSPVSIVAHTLQWVCGQVHCALCPTMSLCIVSS
jgi:6-phosphofructokinase